MTSPGASPIRRLTGPIVALVATVAGGTLGYMLIEGWRFDDAF